MIDIHSETPKIHDSCFVAHSADIMGKVTIAENASIWYNTVVRGDVEEITIGADSNIQDGTVIHTGIGCPTHVGRGVTVGHKSLLHGCVLGDNVLIGMGSIVMNCACIGSNSILGAGSLVPSGKVIPEGVLAMGSPARVVRALTPEEIESITVSAGEYREHATDHKSLQEG